MNNTYTDYEEARRNLIAMVNSSLTDMDKKFLFSFEQGVPDWSLCTSGDLSNYPSVKWKLQNIGKLKSSNPKKFDLAVDKLQNYFVD